MTHRLISSPKFLSLSHSFNHSFMYAFDRLRWFATTISQQESRVRKSLAPCYYQAMCIEWNVRSKCFNPSIDVLAQFQKEK
jgi:hypothetical protein